MITIDEFVLQASGGKDLPPLRDLVHALAAHIDQIHEAGLQPTDDPAVLILGAFIAFHTHSDINTVGGYRKLLGMCEDRLQKRTPRQ